MLFRKTEKESIITLDSILSDLDILTRYGITYLKRTDDSRMLALSLIEEFAGDEDPTNLNFFIDALLDEVYSDVILHHIPKSDFIEYSENYSEEIINSFDPDDLFENMSQDTILSYLRNNYDPEDFTCVGWNY